MNTKEVVRRFKNHWFVALITLCCTVIVATWFFAIEVLVKPRDLIIENLRKEMESIQRQAEEKQNKAVLASSEPREGQKDRAAPDSRLQIVLERAAVSLGEAATTKDGRCMVRVDYVTSPDIQLSIVVDNKKPRELMGIRTGQRLEVSGVAGTYFIDILASKENAVELMISLRK